MISFAYRFLVPMACVSLTLGALGEAGAVVTNNAALADKVRVLRNYGSRTRYYNEFKGVNERMDPVQASMLRCKIPGLDQLSTTLGGVVAAVGTWLGNAAKKGREALDVLAGFQRQLEDKAAKLSEQDAASAPNAALVLRSQLQVQKLEEEGLQPFGSNLFDGDKHEVVDHIDFGRGRVSTMHNVALTLGMEWRLGGMGYKANRIYYNVLVVTVILNTTYSVCSRWIVRKRRVRILAKIRCHL